MEKQIYPVSTASFETIRTRGFVYIDKTEYVYRLASEGVFYFLGRPRRFGKSLLLSSIEAYFKGRRELFDGLAIDRLHPGEWKQYPVLHLNLSGKAYTDNESLLSHLDMYLSKWESEYGIEKNRDAADERFSWIIERLSKESGCKVVILIDEYDSPLSSAIDRPELFGLYREQLHGFYSVLKAMEDHIQFCMLTGVTKFGKVSVFSGLNNLKDISFSNAYAGICGITEAELHGCLLPGVERLAKEEGCDTEEAFRRLKFHYDGYQFSRSLLDIYNPYSVLNALYDSEIRSYWCSSGLPTLLSKMIRKKDYDMERLAGTIVSEERLDSLSVYDTDAVSLFFQTGYLTLKTYDHESKSYVIGYPNREVERGILDNILSLYVPESGDASSNAGLMRDALRKGDSGRFVTLLKAYLSGIPSRLRTHIGQYENYYHTVFYCILSLIGLDIDVEYNTSEGFIDAVVRTPDYIYIIELKVNGTAEDAIRQIERKHYTAPFATDSRRLFCIGIGFSKATGTVSSCLIE